MRAHSHECRNANAAPATVSTFQFESASPEPASTDSPDEAEGSISGRILVYNPYPSLIASFYSFEV
ncbi:Uncharacterised protein [Zhongshania aliphaticivorans]|nr:Uncharacterised protein [Zhongshania aliphaticivorans]